MGAWKALMKTPSMALMWEVDSECWIPYGLGMMNLVLESVVHWMVDWMDIAMVRPYWRSNRTVLEKRSLILILVLKVDHSLLE
jgi:hypothetical protein